MVAVRDDDVTVILPLEPETLEVSVNVEELFLVTTAAVTPMLAELMAAASPESELSVESRVTVCAAAVPTLMAIDPVTVAFRVDAIEVRVPLGFAVFRAE